MLTIIVVLVILLVISPTLRKEASDLLDGIYSQFYEEDKRYTKHQFYRYDKSGIEDGIQTIDKQK